MQDIKFLVGLVELDAMGGPFRVGAGCGVPHVQGDLGHALHDPPAHGGHLPADVGQGPLGDVLGQIGAALQLGRISNIPTP